MKKNILRLLTVGILVLIGVFEAPRLQIVYNYLFPNEISVLLSYVTVGLVTIVSGLIRTSRLSFVPSLVLSVLLIASYIQTFKATKQDIYNEAKNNVQGVPSEPIKPSSNCRRIEDYEARTSCEKAFASQLKAYATSYEIWSKQKIDIDSKNASFESNIDYTKLYIQILIGFAVSVLFSISSWGSSEYLIKSFNTDIPQLNVVTEVVKEARKNITDKEIIKLRKQGYTYAQLMTEYNVSKNRIARVSAKTNSKKPSQKIISSEPKLKLIVNNS